MKGAKIILEKEGILVQSTYTAPRTVNWFNEEKLTVEQLLSQGFKIKTDTLKNILHNLHQLADNICYGVPTTHKELLDIIRELEKL